MGQRDAPACPELESDPSPVVVVEIAVQSDPNARTLRERLSAIKVLTPRRAIVALALVLAIVVAAAAVRLGDRSARRHLAILTRERGPAGVAAAYGYPLNCLSVTTILAGDRAYARADFNHLNRCGQYAGYPTAIFSYVQGAWRPAIDAIGYICPVKSMPATVQRKLGVCP